MSAGTLYTVDVQMKGKIIKAVAALAGIQFDLPQGYTHFETNLTPEYKAKFPHGKIPAWEGKDGFKLFEAIPIARYLASTAPNSGLLGHTPEDAALVDQWTHLAESEVDEHRMMIMILLSGRVPYLKPLHTDRAERQLRALQTLDTHLADNTFFVGERITLADLAVTGFVLQACSWTIDTEVRAKIPNLMRHLETIVNQPKLKDIYGPIPELEKAKQYTPPAKEEKPKKEKAPAPPKAEKEKPKEKPKKEEEEEEDDNLVPAEPKAKSPLDDLPKSAFNLEDWKRQYSNLDTRGPGGSLEWFYKNFDKEGFSIWRVDFKYNEELTQTFMSNNQIGGFFNRLEASRKYLFGSVGVLGKTNDSKISGVFIMRGQKVEGVVDAAPDWESYEYVKLDVEKEEDKKFFEAALAWDLELDGKAWADGKNFK